MPSIGRREIPELDAKILQGEAFETRTYKLRLVTPMFGGGAEAGQIDSRRPIRASSVRGHLRSWWRMLRYTHYSPNGTLEVARMRTREFEIWGSTDNPSPVQIHIKSDPKQQAIKRLKGSDVDHPFGFDRFSPEGYALFSAIEKKDPPVTALLQEGYEFELTLRWPLHVKLTQLRQAENDRRRKNKVPQLAETIENITADIEQSVAAWIAWGGLGARTRRGLGAIEIVEKSHELPDATLPAGSRVFIGRNPVVEPLKLWRDALDVYQRFRQSFRRPRSGKAPGRSHWPEPDSIRKITGCALKDDNIPKDHTKPIVSQNVPNFPRAVLGLPIVFQFKDGPFRGPPASPASLTLDPAVVELKPRAFDDKCLPKVDTNGFPGAADRMASPIITKPIKVDGVWHAGVVILPHEHALSMSCVLTGKLARWDLSTKKAQDCHEAIPNAQIAGPQLSSLCPAEMTDPLRGHQNAIMALIEFLGEAQDGGAGTSRTPKPVFKEKEMGAI